MRESFDSDSIAGLIEFDKNIFDALASFVHYYISKLGYMDISDISINRVDHIPNGDFYIWCSFLHSGTDIHEFNGCKRIENVRCDLISNGLGWKNLLSGLEKYMVIIKRDNRLKELGI